MIYRWQELELKFELQSADEETITTGRRILSPGAPSVEGAADRTWTVDRVDAGEHWRVTGTSTDRSLIPTVVQTRETAMLHVEHDSVDYLLNHTQLPGVHAALLSREGKGVLIVGPSLAGKSTLAISLWRSGWTLLSDDVAFIDAPRRVASPAPRRVSLRFGSRELVGDSLWSSISALPSCVQTNKGLFFHPHELCGSTRLRETPLAAIVFLARNGATPEPAELRRINPAAAAVALVPYAFRVRDLSFAHAVAALSPLVAEVPAYDLGRGNLDEMVKAIELEASAK